MMALRRTLSAVFLIMAYVTMLIGQLAPMALGAAPIAHAISGKCSGDCDIDGCSLASRTNHTCCCWQKRQKPFDMADTAKGAQRPTQSAAPNAGSKACSTKTPQSPPESPSCCNSDKPGKTAPTEDTKAIPDVPVYKCGSPCGDSTQCAVSGLGKIEWVPFSFSTIIAANFEVSHRTHAPVRMTSRYGDPPDSPPKINSHT